MLTQPNRRHALRTLQGWATAVLLEAGAIRECERHGWMLDRGDPHARANALRVARDDPPSGASTREAVAVIEQMLESIGDCCPDCEAPGD